MTTQNGGPVSSRRHISNIIFVNSNRVFFFFKVKGAVASCKAGSHLIITILILLV